MKDWKACERKIAEILGGVRVPVSGRHRGATPDVEHPALSIEVIKSRKSLPGCPGSRPAERLCKLCEKSEVVRLEIAAGDPLLGAPCLLCGERLKAEGYSDRFHPEILPGGPAGGFAPDGYDAGGGPLVGFVCPSCFGAGGSDLAGAPQGPRRGPRDPDEEASWIHAVEEGGLATRPKDERVRVSIAELNRKRGKRVEVTQQGSRP